MLKKGQTKLNEDEVRPTTAESQKGMKLAERDMNNLK